MKGSNLFLCKFLTITTEQQLVTLKLPRCNFFCLGHYRLHYKYPCLAICSVQKRVWPSKDYLLLLSRWLYTVLHPNAWVDQRGLLGDKENITR